jgi:poly-gamma-glutamate synthesis protein (capsule biosynthesis protein)
MKNIIIILFTSLILTSCDNGNSEMSIVFSGDVILDRGLGDEIKLQGDSILINTLKRITKNNFLIVNYEGTFIKPGLTQNDFFKFKADGNSALILKQAGVSHRSKAIKHIFDFGKLGFENTPEILNKNQLISPGENCEPEILIKGRYKCAVISASLTTNYDSLCISTIEQLKNSIRIFENTYSSIPLVLYIHWRSEFQPKPDTWQRELAKDLIKSGVDAIIGHHPSIPQTIEFIAGKPVFYGIGNFKADAYLPVTNYSYIAELTVTDKIQNVKILPVRIENCIPKSIDPKEQISIIKNQLSCSEGICAIQLTDSWLIKPIQSVDFRENTSLWFFSDCKIITAVKRLQTGTHLLTIYTQDDTLNTVSLHGKLSELQISDINNDGITDILLGISKKVHFDPTLKKRINIYSFQNQNLQPLWLGTKFVYDMENFDIIKTENSNFLTTIEIDENGKRFKGTYEWDNFGFALIELNQIKNNEN